MLLFCKLYHIQLLIPEQLDTSHLLNSFQDLAEQIQFAIHFQYGSQYVVYTV